jgi:hypothetical protein
VTRGAERIYVYKNGPPYNIFFLNRIGTADANYTDPIPLNAIHPDENRGAVLSDDELTIYFHAVSRNAADAGLQVFRIWKATRNNPGAQFSGLTYVDELNTDSSAAFPTWLSKDGCEILFSTNRVGAQFDIYRAVKPL